MSEKEVKKLLTLNDVPTSVDVSVDDCEELLRAYNGYLRSAAKAWIKDSEKELKEFKKLQKENEKQIRIDRGWGSMAGEAVGKLYNEQLEWMIPQLIGRINWIKHFFNLEEE